MPTAHIIGAGLAGLAAAVELAGNGWHVVLHEASGHAGGRCRSFHDTALDRTIDNGNHLILSGNFALQRYLGRISASDRLESIRPAAFPFLDLNSGERWAIRPNAGSVPWWVLSKERCVPGTWVGDYLVLWRLFFPRHGATVAGCLNINSVLFERLLKPLAVAVLNIAPEQGDARLLRRVFLETLGQGEAACRPLFAPQGLGYALVDPAVGWIEQHGGTVHYHARLRRLVVSGNAVTGLDFGGETIALEPEDRVVLAVPPAAAAELLPDVKIPRGSTAILNAHYRLSTPVDLPDSLPFLGLIGGTAEWLFVRGDVVSVTVSAADGLMDKPNDELERLLWRDVALALGTDQPPLAAKILKEKRATFAQTPANEALRPDTHTNLRNLLLAGDWTRTGLPATLEGAVRSGQKAALLLLSERSAANR